MSEIQWLAHPHAPTRLGDLLKKSLRDGSWTAFRAAVAFVKRSGTKHIVDDLAAFVGRGGQVDISVGIDSRVTTQEGLLALIAAAAPQGNVWVFHNENGSSFHPKCYLFWNDTAAEAIVGSGNLTQGGIYENYEGFFRILIDRKNQDDEKLFASIISDLSVWCTATDGLCVRVDADYIKNVLVAQVHIPSEADARVKSVGSPAVGVAGSPKLFRSVPVPRAPVLPKTEGSEDDTLDVASTPDAEPVASAESDDEGSIDNDELPAPVVPVAPQPGKYSVFYMTLQQTDVGVGQTTPGKSRRSPEIFLPVAARDADTSFWGWDAMFTEDPSPKAPDGKMDRMGVPIRLDGKIIEASMMWWPPKHEFRIRSEALRSAGNIGDILRVERANGAHGFQYYMQIIPVGSVQYNDALAKCTNKVQGVSKKRWGYT